MTAQGIRLLVCGGRQFTDYYRFEQAMSQLPFTPRFVIHGGAKGADTLADQWGKSHGIQPVRLDAMWDAHGKGAGPKRNQAMLDIMQPNYCVAFPGGSGTADMIRRCKSAGITVWEPYSE